MGKPKALRNRDVGSIIVSEQTSRKRTNFDDPVELNEPTGADDDKVVVASNSLADEPEEVTANSKEVLRMKEMHEKIVDAGLRRSKRRKATSTKPQRGSADVVLDESIFESLEQPGNSESEAEEDDDEDAPPTWRIDIKKSNSRKMLEYLVPNLELLQRVNILIISLCFFL